MDGVGSLFNAFTSIHNNTHLVRNKFGKKDSKPNLNISDDIDIKEPTIQQQEIVNFKIHIAIDFGTDGSALAYCYKDEIIVYNKWKTKKSQRIIKAKSQILLNENNDVVAFGDNAKIIYAGLDGEEKIKWKFFDRFKMSLYGADVSHRKQQYEIGAKNGDLKSLNGGTCNAKIVFVNAFKRLQKTACEYMAKITNNADISKDEIQWIVTVPAIWSERAKSKMKEWIITAGLVRSNIQNQCLIVYEPDCAALSMFEQIKQGCLKLINKDFDEKQGNDNFINDKYILVDAGGGTIDIVCHQIVSKHCAEEIHYPEGNNYGAACIDDHYILLLKEIFGKQCIGEFKNKLPNVYLEILDMFQAAKIKFFKKQNAKTHSVDLPYEFVQYLHQKSSNIGTSLDATLQNWRYKDKVTLVAGKGDRRTKLELSIVIWKDLFDQVIGRIENKLQCLLYTQKLVNCKHLCLVGGFASSKYFQWKMKQKFGIESEYKLNIIIPKKPSLSVVMGAAMYGKKTDFIQARIMKYTYGINATISVAKAKKKGIDNNWIAENMWNKKDVETFSIIVRKGDKVRINEPVQKEFRSPACEFSYVMLLCSENRDPKIVEDGNEIATVRIESEPKSMVIVEYHFHGTMFSIYIYPMLDMEKKCEVQINYGM